MISPHGGKLVDAVLSTEAVDDLLQKSKDLPRISLGKEHMKDVHNIAHGVYSPLTGFLKKSDFESVVADMRLENGLVWSIPIVLDISEQEKDDIEANSSVLLQDESGSVFAILENIEIYTYDKEFFAKNVFGTLEQTHPGVEEVMHMKPYLLGGDVQLFYPQKNIFPGHNFTPAETRKIFNMRGWNSVVAFQTRNVPHRAHEFLQIEALKKADGLFVQPVIGKKKLNDFKDEYIIKAYEIIMEKYYPKNRSVLGILPIKMRYAGPREAVFHALVRKNFGCTHFIVGRDHAGVGSYYGPFEAQEIFNSFSKDEIEIEIVKFPEVVFSKSKDDYCFAPDCPEEDRLNFSGTKLRKYLKAKELPPKYLIRPEVFRLLTETKDTILVDKRYRNPNVLNQKGFVLWFTGLSQSGKSTIADHVYDVLNEKGFRMERLDGDIVRESLTKDLGFSKEDRDENIRRVGFVAKLLARNDVGVLASFISPYAKERDQLRLTVENFIEVFVNTPLEVCEHRDQKGIYERARKGEIPNFTGISDPYEEPQNPEIELRPAEEGVDQCAERVLEYLVEHGFLPKF